ncbi:hypothetical protein [Anabaena sp. UHCC 0204]|uniref:hypothetical protein n=1 Tax=Anabaena sp. UHCC 0204 TaxID=2590009 RepID=UPI001446BDAF|nr:hypothetical protein [Anabaena sp. UHCC 0204]MTJ08557.1 hypothetical protein [Anabaena sp. UHCC 0204]
MTRLFNLESYIDACQYARVFQDSSDQLVPQTRETYKFLLDKYAEHRYLVPPIINNHRSSQLTINLSKLDYLSMGTELTQGEKPRLFIISDTLDLMTLSTSNILGRRDGYLYSSAYYYWNYYTEINQHQITKPLVVFVDLDNFGTSTLIPISFSQHENSHYKIPILDTRNKIPLDHSYNCIETYTKICNSVAGILLNQFPSLSTNNETVKHLSGYLQKINFFQLIQAYVNQESINLIVEIYNNNQIFYKQVTISISEIANIVCQHINFYDINQLENQYPQYQFVLVSQYNIFEKIKTYLPNFICLNPNYQQFTEIWTEKNHLNFPLFAIYLDEIEFQVAISGKEEWIKLSDEKDAISYEGKPTVLIGKIRSLKQDFFRITSSNANLPIKVNGNDYCINKIPQDYKIEIESYQGTEEIRVQIQFNLQPGSFPELKVRDLENKYKINTSLIDRKQKYYSYILPQKITAHRQLKSLSQIERLQRRSDFQSFIIDLHQISSKLDKINSQISKKNDYDVLIASIKNAYEKIKKIKQYPDSLQFIDILSNELVVTELITEFKKANLSKMVDLIYNTLTSNQLLNKDKKDLLVDAIILIGKLYQFSEYLLSDRLFFQLQLQFNTASKIRYRNLSNEYLQCLARIAVNQDLQGKYFSLFNSQYNIENSQYLWGYGNILLWYYDFNSSASFLNYQEHFTKIMNYLLTKYYTKFSGIYKKFAFLSLIYILTFRAHDSQFCQPNSKEFLLAKQVIEHFKHDRIILNTVSREKPLNQYFQELIEGCSTADEIENLLQG